ncbi:MAG: S9 family peptidase [Bacteroidia bacterium]|nr:S9 family peptidase [Bacteroidia bacterium]
MRQKSSRFLIFLFIIFPLISSSQTVLTPELLWKLGRVSDPQVSPAGDKVLYGVKFYSLESNKGNADLWLYDFKTGSASGITSGPENETMGRWSPDGTSIYFLSDKGGSSQLWKMNSDGSGKTQITSLEDDINLYGISPNGDKIWMAIEQKVEKVNGPDFFPDLPKSTGRLYDDLMMRHWDTWEDGKFSHIFIAPFSGSSLGETPVDIMKGEPYDAPMAPFGGPEEIAWSPDAKFLAYTCKKSTGKEYALGTNSDIYLYNTEDHSTEDISQDNKGYDKAPAFSPDGKKIAWITQHEPGNEADLQILVLYDRASKTKKELTKDFDYNVDAIAWGSNGRNIYFLSDIHATGQIFSCDLSENVSHPVRQITSDRADYTEISVSSAPAKQEVVVASRMAMDAPSELFGINLKSGAANQITQTNKEVLKGITFGEIRKRIVKATDGKDILTWVLYPPGFDSTKTYPALLYCQGGPQSTVSQFFSYRWNLSLMAANGYIVVAPNRRGLPGFGSAWNDEISGDWGGQAMRDYLSAIDDVASEKYVDRNRMGAVGASFGGYSVFFLEGIHEGRFKTFIAHCGVFNLESMMATEELFFHNHEFGGPYWNYPQPKSYQAFSPHRFVQNWDTPILIISNERDYRVPYTQGLEAYTAARLKNIPAEYLSFPDENHWVLKPQNSVMWQRIFFKWLDKYLK